MIGKNLWAFVCILCLGNLYGFAENLIKICIIITFKSNQIEKNINDLRNYNELGGKKYN